ncbi:MAG TPA: hypothetical protein IAC03_08085 [Candidatus Coprenecus pullistercoris]|nr:hypothetical protein [Candidatus Coprenecus pullistercoris]
MAFDSEPTTVCAIGMDEAGNYGDMYMEVVEFPESGKSSDYVLFDEYYNAIVGGYAPAMAPASMRNRANYVETTMPKVLSLKNIALDNAMPMRKAINRK